MIESHAAMKEASISAKVIRADGTVEDKGVIAYWSRNPLKRIAYKIKKFIGGN